MPAFTRWIRRLDQLREMSSAIPALHLRPLSQRLGGRLDYATGYRSPALMALLSCLGGLDLAARVLAI
jgi:hypothetical protein